MNTDNQIKQPDLVSFIDLLFVTLFSLAVSDALAKPDVDIVEQGVVRVVTHMSDGFGIGSGFVINEQGVVVTNYHVVKGGTRFSVYLSGRNTELGAQLLHVSQQHDLAILSVSGLNARAVRLSSAEIKKADMVWSVGFPGLADRLGAASDASWSDGAVSRIFSGSWDESGGSFNIVQHTAEINPGNSGGPLFDDCGRVIGINTQGSGAGRITRDASGEIVDVMAGTGVFFASRIDAAIGLLRSKGIDFTAETEPCIPASGTTQDDDARATAQQAQATAEQAGAELQETRSKLLSLSKNFKVWGSVLVVLGILSILLALRKPRERIVRIVEQYSHKVVEKVVETVSIKIGGSVPGLALVGFDTEGKPIKAIISGKNIGQGRGATVGRHPKITITTIANQSISRRQLRFSYTNQTHYIEDLNSSNGTWVNRTRLKPFIKTVVNPGDTIAAGNLEFTLSRYQ